MTDSFIALPGLSRRRMMQLTAGTTVGAAAGLLTHPAHAAVRVDINQGNPQPISIAVYIGLLMLLGIVAKNSILLIDFAIEEMESGVPKKEAIIDAGHKRAQPILMTTVAMTAGMVPTALSLSGDAAWRAPMGITVIGGLLLSTLLTLIIVPAGFSLADGLEKRLGPWLRQRILTYRPEHGEQDRAGAYPAE